ncbi:hypothetical protein [Streptomyces sp. NBRC 109706]|uniref:hypothetical protein n=1 Tax=Streptomyces sp. NBRC 109706 TaxID=1550035 RepID=UPI000784BFC5|nr:hypothetical protein [Streptomyces sp. NBRC 109706]
MSARATLEVMVRTGRGQMTVWSPTEVKQALDRYRAEARADVLVEQADEMVDACPAHGEAEEAWTVCHCEVADEMRRLADLMRPGGDR